MRTRGGREDLSGQETPPPAPPPVHTPAPAAARQSEDPPPIGALAPDRGELPSAYAKMVRRIFTLDVEDAYEQVNEGLRKGKGGPAHRAEYGDIVDELDESSELHLKAHQLAACTAVTIARYEADLEVLQSDMRAQAITALNAERDRLAAAATGKNKDAPKPKQITDSDVESRMAGSYPAEYRRLKTLLAEAKATKKFVDALPEQWAARRRELDGRVRSVRKG